jgi:hypothetical protein
MIPAGAGAASSGERIEVAAASVYLAARKACSDPIADVQTQMRQVCQFDGQISRL